jgi:hypothetical protein
VKPETVLTAIKGCSSHNWLGYFFKLSALTDSLNDQGQSASRSEVALGLDALTKSGFQLKVIIDEQAGQKFELRTYEGDLKRDLMEQDLKLWLIPGN